MNKLPPLLEDLATLLEDMGMTIVFWVCPNGCNGRVTWNKEKTDARCEVCGRTRSSSK